MDGRGFSLRRRSIVKRIVKGAESTLLKGSPGLSQPSESGSLEIEGGKVFLEEVITQFSGKFLGMGPGDLASVVGHFFPVGIFSFSFSLSLPF